MSKKIRNYFRSIKWSDPGTIFFVCEFIPFLLFVIAILLVGVLAIRDWLSL